MSKTRIAVLGGGMGSLSALYSITSSPNWSERFEITLYQDGWRLGGKCVSSRNPDFGHRNEEHGLHVLGGFYHNTFQMIDSCYAEWQYVSQHPIPRKEAFSPKSDFMLMRKSRKGEWQKVGIPLPRNSKKPGVNPTVLSPQVMMGSTFKWLEGVFETKLGSAVGAVFEHTPLHPMHPLNPLSPALRLLQKQLHHFSDSFDELAQKSGLDLERMGLPDRLLQIHNLLENAQALGDRLPWADDEMGLDELFLMIQIACIIARGMIRDDMFTRGFDVANDIESREWMYKHGASDRVANAVFLDAGFHYGFAFVDGDPNQRNWAAGVAVRSLLRMLSTYHDSVFQHMEGGMGEIMITPLYEVLKARGVKFEFFHRVTDLHVSEDKKSISGVSFLKQATPIGEYDPLVVHRNRGCWPEEPLWDQLENGETLRAEGLHYESIWDQSPLWEETKIQKDDDYDVVILGISAGALPYIGQELAEASPRWKHFFDVQVTVPTMAVQLWSDKTTEELGGNPGQIITAFELPLSTWAGMSFLLPLEDPRADGFTPQHMTYFCGPVAGPAELPPVPSNGFHKVEQARAEQIWTEWSQTAMKDLMPKAEVEDWKEVYVRMNSNPSEQYVMSTAGTIDARMRTNDNGFDNLFLTGDWIRIGFDVGAVEATVTAARQCSRAICGYPSYIYGEVDFP